ADLTQCLMTRFERPPSGDEPPKLRNSTRLNRPDGRRHSVKSSSESISVRPERCSMSSSGVCAPLVTPGLNGAQYGPDSCGRLALGVGRDGSRLTVRCLGSPWG